MVKSYTKKLTFFITIISILSLNAFVAFAADTYDTNFSVNVKEALSVSITTPTTWASGDVDEFLRNKVSIDVTSNNSAGFTATMTTKTADTFLTNTSKNTYTLPTLTANTVRSSFPANHWGYSFDDTEGGNAGSTYAALVGANSTPITLLTSSTATSGSKVFYFGAKADTTQAAGTYVGTVVVSVVSGVVDSSTNPVTPTNPATPTPDNNTPTYNPAPTGGSSNGTTTYSYRRSGGSGSSATSTTTTDVTDGNNTDLYNGYTPPQGETYSTTSNISNGSLLITGLASTASIAAGAGFLFLILAKRDDDDDEEEEETQQI